MEPTIKISIGTVAFNIEQRAYTLLQSYLSDLRDHLGDDDATDEIMKDVEYRLCELFQIRLQHNQSSILSLSDIEAVLQIMGTPQDFDSIDEESQARRRSKETKYQHAPKKKLYRDTSNKVIGGVCSGLSHYFQIDVTILRLLVLIPFFIGVVSFSSILSSTIIIYLLLWIIIPEAKSFEQKVVMSGAKLPDDKGEKRYSGSGLTEVLNIVYKVFLVTIIVASVVYIIGIGAGIIWAAFDKSGLYIENYITLIGYDKRHLLTALTLLLILPFVGILGLAYKLYKNTPFRMSNLIIFLLGLTIWLGAAGYLGNKSFQLFMQNKHITNVIEEIKLHTASDTLYIALGEEYNYAHLQPNMPYLLYKEKNSKENKVCLLTKVNVIQDETISTFEVNLSKIAGGRSKVEARQNAKNAELEYNVQDSLITISPQWYDLENPWDLTFYEIEIKAPTSKRVKVLDYFEHMN